MQISKDYKAKVLAHIDSVEKAEDTGALLIEGYANTVVKDRAGDVIPKSAWEEPGALSNYKKNPIILAYHNHSKPIGKAIDMYADDYGLKIKASISKGAGDVYDLIKDGVLSTFSVGFSVKEAKYIPEDDTYYITQVELHEVSVVSVPCNQDSVFQISKSLEDAEAFKQEFVQPAEPAAEEPNKDNQMNLEDIQKLLDEAAAKGATNALSAKSAADVAAAEKAAAEAAAKEAAKKEIQTEAAAAAKALVEELEDKLAQNNKSFAEMVASHQEEIVKLQNEIAAQANAKSKSFTYSKSAMAVAGPDLELRKDISNAVLLGMLTKKDVSETKFGSQVNKAVNQSSSIEVSSEAYETVFSTDLIRDIQAQLVVAPLFREIPMTSANLTIPVNPDRKNATWVAAADFGTSASSGGEITAALTEITVSTMKLAAKTYITDETSEDAIMPLLPLIRMHLVEAHANEIDRAFLLGTGSGEPRGLKARAAAAEAGAASPTKAGGVEVSTATYTGTVSITAKMILAARKKLKLYGLNVRDVTLVVSTEAYYALLEDDAWADMDKVGSQAVKLNGQVGQIYGMPVIVSDQFAAPAASEVFAVLVNTSNFIVPRQRGVTVKTDFDVEMDRRVIVATQRLNLESMIRDANGQDKGVVTVTYAA